ncbi:MAG: hydroxyectoine utilization dehydratase EutB [Anaerolineales bacterium]
MDDMKPHLADIYRADHLIRETIYRTPLIESQWLSELSGCRIFLKLECLQVTGSFKIRGATNKILSLSDDERNRGVIAVSSGNHGRAVAYVAHRYSIPAAICISETVPGNKVQAMRELGAEVIIAGKTYDEASERAVRLQVERGLTMVHPFDDPYVIAGQGTIGLELLEEHPDVDTVIVPLSGGGLLGGIALTLKAINPEIQTIGVSMDQGAAMVESLEAGQVVEIVEEPSLADALIGGLGSDNRHTFKIIHEYVDQTVLVTEDEIAAGMIFALEKEHLVVEGGGAVGIAALLADKVRNLGKKVVVVISGSNVNLSTLIEIAQGHYPYQENK